MNRILDIDYSVFTARDNSVIVKELSIGDVDSQCIQHLVFKPPKETDTVMWDLYKSRRYQWISMHYLDYFEGSVEYANMKSTINSLCKDASFIFSTSQEKAAWL